MELEIYQCKSTIRSDNLRDISNGNSLKYESSLQALRGQGEIEKDKFNAISLKSFNTQLVKRKGKMYPKIGPLLVILLSFYRWIKWIFTQKILSKGCVTVLIIFLVSTSSRLFKPLRNCHSAPNFVIGNLNCPVPCGSSSLNGQSLEILKGCKRF